MSIIGTFLNTISLSTLVPRLSLPPVFDRLQYRHCIASKAYRSLAYCKRSKAGGGEGLGTKLNNFRCSEIPSGDLQDLVQLYINYARANIPRQEFILQYCEQERYFNSKLWGGKLGTENKQDSRQTLSTERSVPFPVLRSGSWFLLSRRQPFHLVHSRRDEIREQKSRAETHTCWVEDVTAHA